MDIEVNTASWMNAQSFMLKFHRLMRELVSSPNKFKEVLPQMIITPMGDSHAATFRWDNNSKPHISLNITFHINTLVVEYKQDEEVVTKTLSIHHMDNLGEMVFIVSLLGYAKISHNQKPLTEEEANKFLQNVKEWSATPYNEEEIV